MLFGGEHVDDEDELGGQEHLDEYALGDRGLACQGGVHVEVAREKGGDDACGADAGDELRDEDIDGANSSNGTDEIETKCYLRSFGIKSHAYDARRENKSVRLTAGLNRPPLILKNAQTLTAKLKPKAREMYNKFAEFGYWDKVLFSVGGAAALATCVAANAIKRNMNVPANSPKNAIASFRTALGMKARRLRRLSFGGGRASPVVNGRTGFLKLTMFADCDVEIWRGDAVLCNVMSSPGDVNPPRP